MIEARKLPKIEDNKTVTLRDFRAQSRKLKSFDYASFEEEAMAKNTIVMFEEGLYTNLQDHGITADEDCWILLERTGEFSFLMNIIPPKSTNL